MYIRVVHVLSTFESFKSHPFKLNHFMKKQLVYNFFEKFSRLGVAQTPQKSKFCQILVFLAY